MAVDFRKFLSPKALARLDARHAEIERLYGLGDRWLARELVGLARRVRDIYPDDLGQAQHLRGGTYDTTYVWDLIPEIAARLGHQDFVTGERSAEIRALDGKDLRDWVGMTMQWLSHRPEKDEHLARGVHPWDLLTTTFVNGNPVVIALDRVAPPTPESDDWCARHMREIARYRGFEDVSAWFPEFNSRPAACEAAEAPAP